MLKINNVVEFAHIFEESYSSEANEVSDCDLGVSLYSEDEKDEDEFEEPESDEAEAEAE